MIIKLVSDNTLKEELFSENLVNTLIKKVIDEKPRNRPEKVLNTYQYKNYEHLLVSSANPDSVSSKIDTISKRNFLGKKYIKIDSTNYKFKKFVEKQHIYQTEKVNLIQYNNKGSKETVLASRMAGLKPIYEYLGLNLVSYSLYTNTLDILEVAVHNPISNYGRKLYVFKIVDTVKVDGKNAYRVYFQPKKLKSNRLRGLLYIDAENSAVCKAFFRIYGIANINVLYTFNYLKDNHLWFPKKRQIMVVKGNNVDDLNILGGTIKFNSVFDGVQKNASDQTYLKLESTPFDIEINKKVTFKNPMINFNLPKIV